MLFGRLAFETAMFPYYFPITWDRRISRTRRVPRLRRARRPGRRRVECWAERLDGWPESARWRFREWGRSLPPARSWARWPAQASAARSADWLGLWLAWESRNTRPS